jgi:hypothetical protein
MLVVYRKYLKLENVEQNDQLLPENDSIFINIKLKKILTDIPLFLYDDCSSYSS